MSFHTFIKDTRCTCSKGMLNCYSTLTVIAVFSVVTADVIIKIWNFDQMKIPLNFSRINVKKYAGLAIICF